MSPKAMPIRNAPEIFTINVHQGKSGLPRSSLSQRPSRYLPPAPMPPPKTTNRSPIARTYYALCFADARLLLHWPTCDTIDTSGGLDASVLDALGRLVIGPVAVHAGWRLSERSEMAG